MSDAVTDLTRGVYRRLYGGFITGQRINRLSLSAEAWFWRVLVSVDDFGNGRADPELCRAKTAGNRRVTARQVSGWLREMNNVGLIQFYMSKGEPFLHVVGFEENQPAGRNGKRFKRVPSLDESGCIQVNPDLSSSSEGSENNTKTTNDTENKTKAAQAPDSPPFSSDEFLEALADFEQHRKEIRHKLTPKAREAMYADFEKWGEKLSIKAIRVSIRNQWRGVFLPKDENSNGTNNEFRRLSAAERNADQLSRNRARVAELRRQSG